MKEETTRPPGMHQLSFAAISVKASVNLLVPDKSPPASPMTALIIFVKAPVPMIR